MESLEGFKVRSDGCDWFVAPSLWRVWGERVGQYKQGDRGREEGLNEGSASRGR